MNEPTRPRFYFELSPDERRAIDDSLAEEEGAIAFDINLGRRLAWQYQQTRYEPLADLVAAPPGERPEVYYDAMRTLLQAAVYEGLNPDECYLKARDGQISAYQESLHSALERGGRAAASEGATPGPEPDDAATATTASREGDEQIRVDVFDCHGYDEPEQRLASLVFPYLTLEEIDSRAAEMATRAWNLTCMARDMAVLGLCLAISDGASPVAPVHGQHNKPVRYAALWDAYRAIEDDHTAADGSMLMSPIATASWHRPLA